MGMPSDQKNSSTSFASGEPPLTKKRSRPPPTRRWTGARTRAPSGPRRPAVACSNRNRFQPGCLRTSSRIRSTIFSNIRGTPSITVGRACAMSSASRAMPCDSQISQPEVIATTTPDCRSKTCDRGRKESIASAGPISKSCRLARAMTTKLGNSLRYVVSKTPWCVGPSGPVRPARSRQKVTGRFCRATSWKSWSKARCRKVE